LKPSTLCILFLGLLNSPAIGQGDRICGLCKNDSELMAKNEFFHQPFPFGRSTNEKIAQDLFWPAAWLETPHFRIGINLDSWKVPQSEKKIYLAELEDLREKWPAIRPKIPVLDMDLRLHLVAERMESFYREFVSLMGMREEDFTDDHALEQVDGLRFAPPGVARAVGGMLGKSGSGRKVAVSGVVGAGFIQIRPSAPHAVHDHDEPLVEGGPGHDRPGVG